IERGNQIGSGAEQIIQSLGGAIQQRDLRPFDAVVIWQNAAPGADIKREQAAPPILWSEQHVRMVAVDALLEPPVDVQQPLWPAKVSPQAKDQPQYDVSLALLTD